MSFATKRFQYILWEDAASKDAWVEADDFETSCPLIESMGFLVEENENAVSLALNNDQENKSFSCIIVIPKGTIISRVQFDRIVGDVVEKTHPGKTHKAHLPKNKS